MTPKEDAELLHKTACPVCPSSDAWAVYSDGHGHCFSCGHHGAADGEGFTGMQRRSTWMDAQFIQGEVRAIPSRGLTEDTCRKYGYWVGQDRGGRTVQIANYRDAEGEVVAQKIRDASKNFSVVGNGRDMPLFGQHLWPTTGKRLVITEGEIDCLSVAQAFNLSWPVVSLPNGAQSAKKAIARALEWICGYEEVCLGFDDDEAGRAAAAECAPLFPPGKCKVITWGLKDASELLQKGRVKDIATAVYQAREYRPDGIVTLGDIRSRVLSPPEMGRPYAIESLNRYTYGRRIGDVIGFGAGTGIGKTDLLTQMIEFDVNSLGIKTGVIFLEQDVGETGKRVAGKAAGKRFHVPDGSWTQEELEETFSRLEATGRLHLYDSWGTTRWAVIREKVRYMIHSLGVEHIYFDHMTATIAGSTDERKELDEIMGEVAGLAKGKCVFHYVSHLATPEGKPHEAGGKVEAAHFRGSRSLAFWSYFMWGIERDKTNPDPEVRSRVTLRCVKDRFTGDCDGRTFRLNYDRATGRLIDMGEFQENAVSFEEERSDSDF